MSIKELRELLNVLELEAGTDETPVYFRDSKIGESFEVNWGYTETDEGGETQAILRNWN